MSKKRSFRLPDGEVVDVSAEEGDALLEIEPKAVEVKSFLVDKDTVDVGLDEVNQLLEIAPNAKPLFEDEPTKDFTKQIANVKPFDMAESVESTTTPPPANMELGVPPAPSKQKQLDLDDKTKAALNKSFSNFPINVLGNKKAREVFYNSYAKSRNLNPAQLRDYGERLAADTLITKGDELVDKGDIKGAEQLYLSQVGKRTETALDRLSKMYAMSGDTKKAKEYAAELDKFQKSKLSQVGTGSYKQPSYFPTELGFAGKQGETIEGNQGGKFYKDMERTPDTEETQSSKYLNDIADAVERLTPGKAQVEMIESGINKTIKGATSLDPYSMGNPKNVSAALNLVVGLGETALGTILGATPSGAANFQPFEVATTYLPENVSGWLMPISKGISEYYDGKPSEDAQNVGFILDTALFGILHGSAKKIKEAVKEGKDAKKFDLGELDPQAVQEGIKAAEERLKQYGGNTIEYKEAVARDAKNTLEGFKEISTIAEGKQEVAPIESLQATFLPELKEGTNVEFTTKNGKESGVIDRLDDGTWVFENENGVTEIPVKDKTNPTETLQELGIDITPEVAPEQVAKAEADAERTGWVTDKGKTYFVSLGNPKIEGSYDLVFERNSQGGLTNRFDSSADPVFAEGRKLKLINKLLEKEGLPKRDKVNQPPIKGKVEQVQKVEPTVEEVKPVEAIKEEVATTVQEAPTVEAAEVVQEPAAVETTEVTPQKPIIEAESPTIEPTITEPVSEAKVVEEVKPTQEPQAELPKEETKGSLLNDIRRFNSLSKKDRQTVGANLKAKIMESASKIEHSLSYDNKGKLILLNKEGKRAKASPKKISDEAKQANKARVESARKALSKTPSTLREWLLQLLLSKQSVSASDLKRATGFSPKEFPAFTVGEKGTTFHDLMEMVQGDPELSHILREYTDNVGFDNQKFDSDIADIMTSIENRESMWRELMEENKENAWRDQGFANKSEYEWALELQVEAERLGVDIEDVKESHIAEAENITKYMEEEDIVKMLQDLDENAPKTIEEINKFYENNNIEQAEVNSEISSTSSVKREVSEAEIKLEKAKAELKNKRKQLLETLLEDNENLFGEKKSSEGKLFDEKADASKMDEALAPLIEKVKEAEIELEQSKKVIPKAEAQTSITSDVGKEVEFNHAGQDRVGTIVGEEGNNYVIESEVGSRKNTYTYPKDKAKVIEDKSPQAIKAKVNKAIDNLEQALLNNPIFKDRSGGADIAGVKGSDVVKFVMKQVRDGVNTSIDLATAIKEAIEKAKVKYADWFKDVDEAAVRELITQEATSKFKENKIDPKKTIKQVIKESTTVKDNTITISEKKALKEVIKREAKAAKEGAKDVVQNITKALDNFKGKLTDRQVRAIVKKAEKIQGSPKRLREFEDFAARVIDDASYSDNLTKAKERASKLAKAIRIKDARKKLGGNNVATVKEFLSIKPNEVESINEYLDIAERLDRSLKKPKADLANETIIDNGISNKEVIDFVEKHNQYMEGQRAIELRERFQDLVDQGILNAEDSKLRLKELQDLVDAFDPEKIGEGLKTKDVEDILADKLADREKSKEIFKKVNKSLLEELQDIPTDLLTDAQAKALESIKKLDVSGLDEVQLVEVYKKLTNIIDNNSFSGVTSLVNLSEIQREIPKKKYVGTKFKEIKKVMAEANSYGQIKNNLFGLDKAAAEASELSGIEAMRNGAAQAETRTTQVADRYNALKAKMGKDIDSPKKVAERWVLADVMKSLEDSDPKKAFEIKKENIKREIENRRNYENLIEADKDLIDKLKQEADLLEQIYNEHVKNATSADQVYRSFENADNRINQLVREWQREHAEIEQETYDSAEMDYDGKPLPRQRNYTASEKIRLKSDSSDAVPIIGENTFAVKGVKNKMAGSKNVIKERLIGPKEISNIDFDNVQIKRYLETSFDNLTAKSVDKVKQVLGSKYGIDLFGSVHNRSTVANAVNSMYNARRGNFKYLSEADRAVMKTAQNVANNAVRQALFGVSQTPLQYISVASRALFNIGFDYKLWREAGKLAESPVLDEYNISSRGQSVGGTKKQTLAEKLDLGVKNKDGVGSKIKETLEGFLTKADVSVARQSWVSYYLKFLKDERGLDLAKEDLNALLEERNPRAASYAEHMVETTQNANDPASFAKIYHRDGILGGGAGTILKEITMPFNSFSWNMKGQQIADVKKIARGGDEAREGVKSLAGNVIEQVVFNTIKMGLIATATTKVADELSKMFGIDLGKENDAAEKVKEANSEKIGVRILKNSIEDIVLGGLPNQIKTGSKQVVNTIQSMANNDIQGMMMSDKLGEAWNDRNNGFFYVPESDFGYFGTYGIPIQTSVDMAKLAPLAVTGKATKYLGEKGGVPQFETVDVPSGVRNAALVMELVNLGKMTGFSDKDINSISRKLNTDLEEYMKLKYGGKVEMTNRVKPKDFKKVSVDNVIKGYKNMDKEDFAKLANQLRDEGSIDREWVNELYIKDPKIAEEFLNSLK